MFSNGDLSSEQNGSQQASFSAGTLHKPMAHVSICSWALSACTSSTAARCGSSRGGREGGKGIGTAFRCHVTLSQGHPIQALLLQSRTMTNNSVSLPYLSIGQLWIMFSRNAQLKLRNSSLFIYFLRFVCECDLNAFLKLGGSRRVSDSNERWRGAMPRRRKAFTLACRREADSSTEVRWAGFRVVAKHYSVTQSSDGMCASNPVMCINC